MLIENNAACVYCNRRVLQERYRFMLWCAYCGTLGVYQRRVPGADWFMGYKWYFPEGFDLDKVAEPEREDFFTPRILR